MRLRIIMGPSSIQYDEVKYINVKEVSKEIDAVFPGDFAPLSAMLRNSLDKKMASLTIIAKRRRT